MLFLHRAFILVIFTLSASPVVAEEGKAPDPLFRDMDTLNVTITAPLTTLVKERPKEDFLPGMFQVALADGSTVDFDVQIRTRGHFRHDNCDFPPLWLDFKKSQTNDTLFDKQDKLKLVVHCDDSERYEQIVLREYLVYRLLNAVTEQSLRARLLRVTYVDNQQKRDEQVRYAFLVEHKNRLGKRYDMKDLKIAKTSISAIQGDKLNLTSIFQYMIGNTDFSPIAGPPGDECCHNYVLFKNDTDPIVAIPYDFDQAGIVDAPYATPNEAFRIRTVRQRLYRGRCANNQYIDSSLLRVQEVRDTIYALVNEQEGFTPKVRKTVIGYIDDFYKLIDNPKDVDRRIVKRCV